MLLSFLYDLDLLPEQITTDHQARLLCYVCEAFILGKETK